LARAISFGQGAIGEQDDAEDRDQRECDSIGRG
jgi:hypothetical protein